MNFQVGRVLAFVLAALVASCASVDQPVRVIEMPTEIGVTPSSVVLPEGRSVVLVAQSERAPVAVRWTSSDSTIASVASEGRVTGKAPGTAVIIATPESSQYAAAAAAIRVVPWASDSSGLFQTPKVTVRGGPLP